MRKQARKLSKFNTALSDEKGLTLIDVAITLIIVGLLATPALYALREYKEEQARLVTEDNIRDVDEAIRAYFVTNEFYPCPANPALNIHNPADSDTHGDSQVDGTGACTQLNGSNIAEGSVPHTELGLDIEKIYDGWGNKILYAVDISMASDIANGTPAAAGTGLTIAEIPLVPNPNIAAPVAPSTNSCNELPFVCADTIPGYAAGTSPACNAGYIYPLLPTDAGYPSNNVQYTLLSHGEDGRGAFNDTGAAIAGAACDGTNAADDENCDGDNVYQTRQCVNADTSNATRFDDFIVAAAVTKTDDPTAMMSQSDNNDDGIAVGVQFVGIKNSDPQRELDVIGNIKISDIEGLTDDDKDGAARADDYCDPTGEDCFDAALIGGDMLASPCPTGTPMIGIKDNGPICERRVSENVPKNTNCAKGVSSISIPTSGTGSVTCVP